MADGQEKSALDRNQVKRAVLALQAFLKNENNSQSILLNEHQHISLLFTLWKIPRKEQTIRIPLPHGIRTENGEVCLFTRDEPNMTTEQTERFFRKLLKERKVKTEIDVIPFKVLKTEYKSFESKRRLLGNFDLFLSDARIRRLLPSHIGKHFYESKKAPLSVDLQVKNLSQVMERLIQGTTVVVGKKGPCSMARVAHSGMSTDEIVENIAAAFDTFTSKLNMTEKDKMVKIIHLKSQKSVALPIYTSNLSHLALVEEARKKVIDEKKKTRPAKGGPKKGPKKMALKKTKVPTENSEAPSGDEEEIPQLVPIQTPAKKAKLESPANKGQKKVAKPKAGIGRRQAKGAPGKLAKKMKKLPAQKRKKAVKS